LEEGQKKKKFNKNQQRRQEGKNKKEEESYVSCIIFPICILSGYISFDCQSGPRDPTTPTSTTVELCHKLSTQGFDSVSFPEDGVCPEPGASDVLRDLC
jgi:hypothetical protein